MNTETHTMGLLQGLMKHVRERWYEAPEPWEISGVGASTIEHGGERLHLVSNPAIARRLLADKSLSVSPQVVGLTRMCEHFGLDGSLVGEFFERSPIFLEGDAHRDARKRFSRLARVAKNALEPELDLLVDAHFEAVCHAGRGAGLGTVGAIHFVDRMLFRLFELLLPG